MFSWAFWTIPIFVSLGAYPESLKKVFGVGVIGPIVVSVLLSTKALGGEGIGALWARFSLKGVKLKWYLVAAFAFVGISLATLVIHFALDGAPPGEGILHYYTIGNYLSMLPIFLVFATFEEVGWRGYAMPRLRRKYNALTASLVLGLITAVWHFPKLVSEGMTDVPSIFVFTSFVVPFSVLFSWIYENTNGSVAIAILTHAAANAAMYAISPEVLVRISYNPPSLVFVGVLAVFAAVIVLINGPGLRLKAPGSVAELHISPPRS